VTEAGNLRNVALDIRHSQSGQDTPPAEQWLSIGYSGLLIPECPSTQHSSFTMRHHITPTHDPLRTHPLRVSRDIESNQFSRRLRFATLGNFRSGMGLAPLSIELFAGFEAGSGSTAIEEE
jgi:hypothetical protein